METASTVKDEDGPLVVEEPVDLTLAEHGFGTANLSPAARAGLKTLFGGVGFRMFVKETLFTKLITLSPQRQWVVYGNPPSPASRAQIAGAEGRLGDGKDVGTSYGVVTQNGKRYVSFTCFQCHAGVVAGKLVAGLGNGHIDQHALEKNLEEYKGFRDLFRNDLGGLSQALVQKLVGFDAEDKEHLKWFTLYSETILRPAIKQAAARGDDYGPYPVWQLLTRMKNPAASGFDLRPLEEGPNALEQLVASTPLGPVDRRPWWLRKFDTKSYVYGDTLTDPRAGKDFAINFFVPHANHNATYKQRGQEIASILAFALETTSPPYPYVDDVPADDPRYDPRPAAATVEEGRTIYNANCARCHGSVERQPSGKRWKLRYRSMEYKGKHDYWQKTCLPDVLYSTDKDAQGDLVDAAWTTDTDLVYSCALMRFNEIANAAAGINAFFAKPEFGIDAAWRPEVYNPEKPGYRAPPLVGIWASAPYLHNGSLPTLGDLFLHERLADAHGAKPRPIGWSRVLEVSKDLSYDAEMIGMQVEPFYHPDDMPRPPGLPYDHKKQVDYRRLYDTRQPGRSAAGAETCGGRLDQKTKQEKDKVLAFLRELTDENVEPDAGECPHPVKPRLKKYGDPSYKVYDHSLCKSLYAKLGVPSN